MKDHLDKFAIEQFKFYAHWLMEQKTGYFTDGEIAQALIEGMGNRAVGVAIEIRAKLAPIL